jgi:phage baseplate assembly protein W
MAKVLRTQDYSDLDLDFLMHPTTKDVVKKTGEDAIKRSIRNLVLTNYYDRPFRSFIGSSVYKLLFDNATPMTAKFMEDSIIEVIENFEPRARVIGVGAKLNTDDNGFNVSITFTTENSVEPITTFIFLERIR